MSTSDNSTISDWVGNNETAEEAEPGPAKESERWTHTVILGHPVHDRTDPVITALKWGLSKIGCHFNETGEQKVRGWMKDEWLGVTAQTVGGLDENRYAVTWGESSFARQRCLDEVKIAPEEARVIVVMAEWGTCSDSLGELRTFLKRCFELGASVTATHSSVILSPSGQIRTSDLLEIFAGLTEARNTKGLELKEDIPRVLKRDWQGRTPIGCEVRSGNLVRGELFEDVRDTVIEVEVHGLSKRAAADRLDCSIRTVGRILNDPERRELYRLPE